MSDDPLLGKSVAQFRVKSRLGQGGMGAVYRAEDTRLRREVALKVLPLELTFVPERRARLLREARAAAAVTHPNVATVYEVGETEHGLIWIAMELVDGESLRALLAREKCIPVEESLRILHDIAAAVGRAHERGIVHRDLKPENVMLDADGHVKVLDFGLAKARETIGADDADTPTAEILTREGAILGTPEYMAPEQARGSAADARADVFALGVMLHEMVSGERPFRGETALQVIASILTQDPPPLTGAPAEVAALARACMAREPEARPRDGRALASLLARPRTSIPSPQPDIALLPTLGSNDVVAAPKAAKKKRVRWTWLAIGIAALASAGIAAWMAKDGPVPSPRAAPSDAPSRPVEAQMQRLTSYGSSATVRDVALSPDRRTLAFAFGDQIELRPVGGGEASRIRAPGRVAGLDFDASNDRLRVTLSLGWVVVLARDGSVLEERRDVLGITRSPDGTRVAVMTLDGTLWVERGEERTLLRRGFGFADSTPTWSLDGEMVAVVDSMPPGPRVTIVSMDREVERLRPEPGLHQSYTPSEVQFDRDGCLLFFLSEPTPAAVLHRSCRAAEGWSAPEAIVRVTGGAVPRFAIDEHAKTLYAVVSVRQIDLWTAPIAADGSVGSREPALQTDGDERDPAWLSDGSLVFQAQHGGRWTIERLPPLGRSPEPFVEIPEHATYPEPDADGNVWFFSTPLDGGRPTLARRSPSGEIVRVREVGRREEITPTGRPIPHDTQLTCAARVPQRCLLIERDEVGTMVSWLEPPSAAVPLDVEEAAGFALSPDGATLAVGSITHGLRFFDARDASFRERAALPGAPARVQFLAFEPEGTRLFSTILGDNRQSLVVSLDLEAGATHTVFDGGDNWLQGLAVDVSGARLAGGEMFVTGDVYRVELP